MITRYTFPPVRVWPCLLLALIMPLGLAAKERPPNVVLILIDDLSYFSWPAYGAKTVSSGQGHFKDVPVEMPNIDRLAEEGVRFNQAYVHPICEPTRVALMTGMHNGRNFLAPKAVHESQITFSDVFKKAGYATGMYGKWKQTRGTPSVPGNEYISQFGWDDYLCFDVTNDAKGWRRYLDPTLFKNGEQLHYTKDDLDPLTGRRYYGPDLCNRAALQFIDDHKDEPFFLYYPMILVHDEHTPTPDTVPASLYDDFDTKTKLEKWLLAGDDRTYFPDMLKYMDKMIGNIINKLDEDGLLDDTLIIVMGDNGGKEVFEYTMDDGTVFGGGKGHNRFHGEQIPLIFTMPGVIPQSSEGGMREYDGLFDGTDIYPTLMEACGIELPNAGKIDGVSAWQQIIGKEDAGHRDVIYKWANGNSRYDDLDTQVEFAHNAEFKRYAPHDKYPRGRFFDLRTDPYEHAGEKGRKVSWDNHFHSGLDLDSLTPEQQAAFDMLGEVLEENAYVPVEALQIQGDKTARVGHETHLHCRVIPANAMRNNVIWESSDPAIATVDKFGVLTPHAPGEVEINVYSWEDAEPLSNNGTVEYRRDGIKDILAVNIVK
ncbi:sulfatase-like hydrolase/transferase [Rubellicoccus peritrichatus]|uniref:Sulfatase-like hydrolase/transferase n=1 Tax=Rubellicoccus peritrichatus TaxID=3080537 RepID=A0AAQ3L9H3_9BACT|nr:sulfatase-like hydrolase/transferase [Puniceicoccus sp. CR14]WOO39313.1 sulfatase-like hydrolase/transferase [Puniceicoccus sp. CR14]